MVVATAEPVSKPAIPKKLRRLAAENRGLKLQIQNTRLKARRDMAVHEASSALLDTLVDRLDYLPANYGFGVRAAQGINTYSTLQDRRDGRNAPFIEDEVDAAYARGLARWIAGICGPAVGVSENLKNYVIGTGYTLSASTRKSRQAPEGLIDDVQLFLDDLLKCNRWMCDLDREFYWRAERDGETFLALFYLADGSTSLRFVEPEMIEDPKGRPWEDEELAQLYRMNITWATSWSFGVHTYEHDTNHVLGYCVRWAQGEQVDYLPASQVIHLKLNVDRNIKRGLTSFYPVWRWLMKQENLLAKMADGAERLAAIAYIVQYALSTQEQVKTMRTGQADAKRNKRLADGGTETNYRRTAGSQAEVVDIPKGQEYKEGPHGAERGHAFLEIVQGLLRQVGIRFCMPEYMVSGDASNGNYSSSIEAGGPFNKFCEARQGTCKTYFAEVLWKCLEHAYLRGRFRRHNLSWFDFQACVDVSLTPPDVAPNKGSDATTKRSTLFRDGVLSVETYQEQEKLDPDKEKARGANGVPRDGGGLPGQAIGPTAAAGAVQDTALNGAQVSSLLEMLAKAKSGEIPAASVGPMIRAAFPAMTEEEVNGIVAPLSELAKAPVSGPAAQGFTGITRMQWVRIERAVQDIAAKMKAGTMSPVMAKAFLSQFGLTPEQVTALVDDASDGSIDMVKITEALHDDLFHGGRHVWEGYP